jgi:hypothetical protein
LFEYVDAGGKPIFRSWRGGLDTLQRAKLDSKINILRTSGADLATGLLAGTSSGHIKKLKVQGNVKLRPRLCEGPIHHGTEFSLLVGAVEKDMKTIPANADELSTSRRSEIIQSPTLRRCPYVV